jgi:hypothetical protein
MLLPPGRLAPGACNEHTSKTCEIDNALNPFGSWLLEKRCKQAVQAWLNGEFGIDDEPALIEALRRDPRVIGSNDQIIDTFCNAMVEGWDAQRTFERLTHYRRFCDLCKELAFVTFIGQGFQLRIDRFG